MATPVIMPRQGQSVETCIITEWHKKKGDKVTPGDVLFSYETDKAAFEEEAEVEGELLDVFFEVDDEVPVLTNVAVIGEAGESVDEFRPQGEESGSEKAKEEPAEKATPEAASSSGASILESAETSKAQAPSPTVPAGETKASPRAKRIAGEKNVPIQGVSGTGPAGRVIARDVEAGAAQTRLTSAAMSQLDQQSASVPTTGTGLAGRVRAADLSGEIQTESKPLSNIRKTIAKRMLSSLQNTAQLTLNTTADARRLKSLRKRIKAGVAEGGPNITINDMVCAAVIKALQKHPQANAHFLETEIKYFGYAVHLGIAVDTERGLMVPTVQNAHGVNIVGLGEKIRELAGACRSGSIDPGLLEGASFTVTNLGAYGIESFTPVLNPPQVGILGINTITYQPADLGDGSIGFVPRIGLSLTFDHRALDGAPAAAFLQGVCKGIENLEVEL
ncbi:MAG: dihydrolipoamide acetyltransferase family protein [Lentisphaeria bacterium]